MFHGGHRGGCRRHGAAWGLGAGLALLGAAAASAVTNTIQSIDPASAPQGTNGLLVTFTIPAPPPTNVAVSSATLGSIAGTALARPTAATVTARFNIPGQEPPASQDVVLRFPPSVYFVRVAGFTVTPAATLSAGFTAAPTSGVPPLTVAFTDASAGTVTNRLWEFGDGTTSAAANPAHTYLGAGLYSVTLTVLGPLGTGVVTRAGCIAVSAPPANGAYTVVDTGLTHCYGNGGVIPAPAPGQPFYGQDAQHAGPPPAYRDNGDGTVSDLTTGLMWVQARGAKVPWETARSNAAACAVGGHTDWRLPTIKELYSLILFTGANGQGMTTLAGYVPFLDTNYFGFAYGSGTGDERVIDCQDWSATPYVSTTMNGDATIFGVNFADGRIKGYPQYVPGSGGAASQALYARYVRGNPDYGRNHFVNHGDGTVTDRATGLMWARDDSGGGLDWSNALAWAQAQNAANYRGHSDWRVPDVKELQSLVDYTRSPATTASAAIDPVFNCTPITNEAGQLDFAFYWSGTTHLDGSAAPFGAYVCFGRALGLMDSAWLDVHGAGAQRSDPKAGNPADYPAGHGPQGDAVRIRNAVRLVRDAPATPAWRFAFVGDTHVPLSGSGAEIAAAAVQDDARVLLVAGDLVEAGARASPNPQLTQLAAWREALAPARAAGLGVYVVRGNHEDDVTNGLAAWNAFFSGTDALPGNGPPGESNLTYAFAYSNALFIGLDDYAALHRVNQPWLTQQLAANPRPHVFVFGHEPAFKTFHTDCLGVAPAERNAFWNTLAAAGARLYLCGHDHLFDLARLDDGDGEPDNDLHQCIAGTGGSTNWPVAPANYNGTNAPYAPVNVARVTNAYGYLLIEVSGPGPDDLGVTLTWKQRAHDPNTAAYLYVASPAGLAYAAPSRSADSVGDGIPDAWRTLYFSGGAATNATSCAECDPDADGVSNAREYAADTNPTNPASRLHLERLVLASNTVELTWSGGVNAWQYLVTAPAPTAAAWSVLATNAPPTPFTNAAVHVAPAPHRFYRIEAHR